jgi:hypothetical protein
MMTGERSSVWSEARGSRLAADRRGVRLSWMALAVLGLPFAVATLVQLVWSVRMLAEPGEAMYGEAIIYDQAARLHRGEPLYQPPDRPPYTVAAYTPFYYWVTAGLQRVLGPGFWTGRALSVAAGLAVSILVGYLAANQSGDRRAGLFAALLFLAFGLPGIPPWSALYKQDVLGVAFSIGASSSPATWPRSPC